MKLTCFSLLVLPLIIGCSKKADSDSTSGITIGGSAIFGPVNGATVSIYAVDSSGNLASTPLATGTTDSSGNYSINLDSPPSGPIAVQLTGGSYAEEAGGATVSLSNKTYTTLLPSVSDASSYSAALGPLPDMAYQKFAAQMQSGLPGGTTIEQLVTNSNYQVSQAFGLPDIVGVVPANPYGTIPNDATGQYALVLAAISKAANTAGTDSTAMAAAYAKALLQNGNLAGMGAQTVKNSQGNNVSITPPSMSSLAGTVAAIGNGQIPMTGVTPPSGFIAPTFNANPSTTAPSDYMPGAPITQPIAKGIASVWTVSNSAWSIDWTGANTTGTPFTIKITFSTGAQCSCALALTGTNYAGSCAVSTQCSFVNGTGTDPGCATSSNFGMCAGGGYANDGTNMKFTSGATYH
jgi:hypothetical protein